MKFDFKNKRPRSLIKRISKSEVFDLKGIKKSTPENPLPYNGGLFTIKITKSENPALFVINDKNMIDGYIHADKEAKTLDLTSNSPKLLLICVGSFYHFFLDDVGNFIEAVEQYPDHEIIIDITRVDDLMSQEDGSFTFFFEFLELLKFYNLKHKVVKLSDFDIVYIDNFYIVNYNFVSSLKAEKIYEFFSPYIKDPDEVPYRSVYVSRRRQDETLRKHRAFDEETGFFYDGLRIDDEIALEKVFLDLGFEVVYPEDFSGFDEQVNFFNSVKTIVSLTSSGLTNGVFMQPGGTMVELVSPVIANPIAPDGEQESLQKGIHNFYKDIAFLKNHTFLAIQNPNFKVSEVRDAIESNPKVREFLRVTND